MVLEKKFQPDRHHKLGSFLVTSKLKVYRITSYNVCYTKLLRSTLYYEWQTSDEAKHVNKSFEQSIQFPFPLHAVHVSIDRRLGFEKWESLLQFSFNPNDKLIRKYRNNFV